MLEQEHFPEGEIKQRTLKSQTQQHADSVVVVTIGADNGLSSLKQLEDLSSWTQNVCLFLDAYIYI